MIWALDLDDDQLTLLTAVASGPSGASAEKYGYVNEAIRALLNALTLFRCPNCLDTRWWSYPSPNAGQCGVTAPPINDKYLATCDPFDAGYHCCGAFGYCGTGTQYCNCSTCVDYSVALDKVCQSAPDDVSQLVSSLSVDL